MPTAGPLVDGCVELESYVVATGAEADGQCAEVPGLEAVDESLWEPEIEQCGWPWIQPVPCQSQCLCDVDHCVCEGGGEGLGTNEAAILEPRHDIEVLGRPLDSAEQQKCPSTYEHEVVGLSTCTEELAEDLEGLYEVYIFEHGETVYDSEEDGNCRVTRRVSGPLWFCSSEKELASDRCESRALPSLTCSFVRRNRRGVSRSLCWLSDCHAP